MAVTINRLLDLRIEGPLHLMYGIISLHYPSRVSEHLSMALPAKDCIPEDVRLPAKVMINAVVFDPEVVR